MQFQLFQIFRVFVFIFFSLMSGQGLFAKTCFLGSVENIKGRDSGLNLKKLENSHAQLFEIYELTPLEDGFDSERIFPSSSFLLRSRLSVEKTWDQWFWVVDEKDEEVKGQLREFYQNCLGLKLITHSSLNIAALSATHIGYLSQLDELDRIKAVSDRSHIYSEQIQARISQREVVTLGFPPRVEAYINSGANIITAFIVSDPLIELGGLARRSHEVVYIHEFRESHPLARAEWIKFFGALTGKLEKAKRSYSKIEESYRTLKDLSSIDNLKLLTGAIYNDEWHLSNPDSDFVKMSRGLGAELILADSKQTRDQTHPQRFGIESFFIRISEFSGEINLWIPLNSALTWEQLKNQNRFYEQMTALELSHVWNPVGMVNNYGANEFWELISVRPDLVLLELYQVMELSQSKSSFDTKNFQGRWFTRLK